MRKHVLNIAFFVIVLLFPFLTMAQISDTVRKYPNGNILLKQPYGGFELKTREGKSIAAWNNSTSTGMLGYKRNGYEDVYRRLDGKRMAGIFDAKNGVLVLPLIYSDIIFMDNTFEGLVQVRKDGKFGMVSLKDTVNATKPIYKYVFNLPNKESLMLFGDTIGYIINNNLQVIDSILGFLGERPSVHDYKKGMLFIRLTYGDAILDKHNQLFYEKGWTEIADISGNYLVVATKNGFGLYDLFKKELTEPYQYKSYAFKGYENERFLLVGNKESKLFDSSGKKLLTIKADSVMPLLDEWAGFFILQKGKWGVIDANGKMIIKPTWKKIIGNPRFEAFEGILPNGSVQEFYCEYISRNGQSIITQVVIGSRMFQSSKSD